MNLTDLPPELICMVVDYVSGDDLVQCSAVNTVWEDVFNNNMYWKMACLKCDDASLFDYLRDNKCKVPSNFEDAFLKCPALQSACEWKLNFMKWQFLRENREQGRYSVDQFLDVSLGLHYIAFDKSNEKIMYYLFESKMEIWNIADEPVYQATVNDPGLDMSLDMKCQLTSDQQTLVVLQGQTIHVFHICGTDYVLQFRKHVLIRELDRGRSLFNTWKYNMCYAVIVGKLVFGVCYYDDRTQVKMCMWEWERDTDASEFTLHQVPNNKKISIVNFSYLERSDDENVIVASMAVHSYNMSHQPVLVTYGCDTGEIRNVFVNGDGICLTVDNLCIVRSDTNVMTKFFHVTPKGLEYITSVNDFDVDLTLFTCHRPAFAIHESHFAYTLLPVEDNCIITTGIKVIDLNTTKTLSNFNVTFPGVTVPIFLELNILPNLHRPFMRSYGNVVTLDRIYDDIMMIRFEDTLQVWNWRKQTNLYFMPHVENSTIVSTNQHLTRVNLVHCTSEERSRSIISFW